MFGNLWFEDYVKIGDDIWFSAGNYNGLYRFNMLSRETKRVSAFPDEPISREWAFRRVKLWERKLVFMPAYADAVYLYDLEKEVFERIDVLEADELLEYQSSGKFQCYEIFGEWLYLIGYAYPGIIKVNLKNHQIIKLTNIPPQILIKNNETEGYFGAGIAVEKSNIYITCPSSNRILILDMCTDCFDMIEVGDGRNKYMGIQKIGQEYYLIRWDNDNIIRWNRETGNCTEIELKFDNHFFDRKICQTQNYIWVFSYISNEIFRINKNNYNISKIRADIPNNRMSLIFCEEMRDGIYFLNMYDGEWHILKEDGIDENLHFIMKEPDKINLMKQLLQEGVFKKGEVLSESENSIATLELLLLKILESEDKTEEENYMPMIEK